MPREIIRKLTSLLKEGITIEDKVVYLLVGIRKLIEAEDQGKEYPNLKFHCDWVLHSKLTGPGAQAILRAFDNAHPFLKRKEDLAQELQKEIGDICGLRVFQEELERFLDRYCLPPIARDVDDWSRFFHLYSQVIQDIPLEVKSSSRDAAKNISKIVVHVDDAKETIRSRYNNREEFLYRIVWKTCDETGGVGRHEVYNSFNIARAN